MKLRLLFSLLVAAHAFAAPVSLFDGKSLEGWESREPSLWKVEDGCIVGGGVPKIPHNDFLCTKRSFSNFVLKLKIKLTGDPATGLINSGVQIRTARNPTGHEVCGYQCDYGEPSWYGGIYDEGRRNKFIAPADMTVLHPAIKLWDWNEYTIRAEGNRIQTWINGVSGVDYKEEDPNIPQDGILGVQVHAGGNTNVQLKDITIEELPPTPEAPTWEKLGGVEGVRAKVAPPKKSAEAKDSDPRENAGAGAKPKRDISYNAVVSTAKTPEEERAAFTLPDGFEAELVAAESDGVGKFVPIAFDQHGALWTTTAFEYPVDGNENPAAADALYASHAKDKVLIYDRDPKSPTGYASKPRVFMDGLAIPLGVLPYKNGCYVLHGHDIVFAEDTDADGKADKTTVILTGFGVQDSHLFPHQFMRAPGGWIWMAQGAFNYGKVSRPGDEKNAVQFDQTRMAKFRPDGSGFDITSNGPCNIWGLVLNGEGEAFIQEANDFGYPVMPFHEYANYPGCSDRQWKSYAPEFPGTAPDFKMGGTGLSGLALTDKAGPFPEPWRDIMLVANPITNRIQAIKMHRDGPYWKLDTPVDFLVSSDPWFRPVAITVGPDGCLYIVDWYNKIISHNEVPRNHPDRDKTRGRIWRVKAKAAKPFDVPDFTKLSGDELIAKLGGDSLAQSHLAWQTLGDRTDEHSVTKLQSIAKSKNESAERRIQALWVLGNKSSLDGEIVSAFLNSPDRALRREAVKSMGWFAEPDAFAKEFTALANDPDPEVRAEVIRALGVRLDPGFQSFIPILAHFAREPLAEPVAPSTRNGKPIKVREAYDREFERYLVRMFLERQPDAVAKFLDSDAAKPLPVEARLLASLALEPKASAARVAKLLPQLQRAPGQEEVLRLAQFPDEPGVGEALRAILSNPATRTGVLDALLAVRTRLDAAKLAPMLSAAAGELLKKDEAAQQLGIQLASSFKLAAIEPALVEIVGQALRLPTPAGQSAATSGALALQLAALRALADIGSSHSDLFAKLAESSPDLQLRGEALAALAASKAPDAPAKVLALYPKLAPAQRHTALDRLSTTKPGAAALVAALAAKTIPTADLDGPTLDRLQTVLGAQNPELTKLIDSLGNLFRPVLALDGSDDAWVDTQLSFDGALTVETWVRLTPEGRKIGNVDGLLGVPGKLDLNFFDSKFRVYAGGTLHDVVVATKPIAPDMWTHIAAVRTAEGRWSIFINGELDNANSKAPAPGALENVRIGWTGGKGGTQGAFAEYRLWNRARTADEIRRDFDRSFGGGTRSVASVDRG
ncbi:MAG: PVC-type heme-binding CxxCH protein, partial [Chthoniobacteraceae bacterium]